jgi:hypothetical protein
MKAVYVTVMAETDKCLRKLEGKRPLGRPVHGGVGGYN